MECRIQAGRFNLVNHRRLWFRAPGFARSQHIVPALVPIFSSLFTAKVPNRRLVLVTALTGPASLESVLVIGAERWKLIIMQALLSRASKIAVEPGAAKRAGD